MFIRAKKYDGRTYYALVSSRRQDGKVVQKIEAYLGKHPTIEGAIAGLEAKVRALKERREVIYRQYFGPKPPLVHQKLEQSYRHQKRLEGQVNKLRLLARCL
jgi:hypothetical protein